MNRLKQHLNFTAAAVNTILTIFFVCIFFTVLHIVWQEDERQAIRDALDARANSESRLQHAARDVCNDHPRRDGRELEPVWTPEGQLECHLVVSKEGGQR